jgi:hypothetical protein
MSFQEDLIETTNIAARLFPEQSRSGMEWCRRMNAPAELTQRVVLWLERLERRWPS